LLAINLGVGFAKARLGVMPSRTLISFDRDQPDQLFDSTAKFKRFGCSNYGNFGLYLRKRSKLGSAFDFAGKKFTTDCSKALK
jgi:hypothetical protein